LRNLPGLDPQRIFVLGHSQGAMMAPRIAQRAAVAGLLLLAAPARPLQDVYVQQLEFLGAPSLDEERRKAADPAAHRLMGLPAGYWNDLRGYDPVAVAGTLSVPLLVLQGGRDYQVTSADDFARWHSAFDRDPRVVLKSYAALNHLFIAGEGPPSAADYQHAGQVSSEVIDDIARWVLAAR
jgi:pimeloyl-ACP methyl ester carboxylesterase